MIAGRTDSDDPVEASYGGNQLLPEKLAALVAIAVLFPERHLARVFAAVAGVWGIATVLGPMVGGIFAETGDWRMVFWLFVAQAGLFAIAAPFLLKATAPAEKTGVPWLQLGVLGLAVVFVAVFRKMN